MTSTMTMQNGALVRVAHDEHETPPHKQFRLFILAYGADRDAARQTLTTAGYAVVTMPMYLPDEDKKVQEANRRVAIKKAYQLMDICDGVALGGKWHYSHDLLDVHEYAACGPRFVMRFADIGRWLLEAS